MIRIMESHKEKDGTAYIFFDTMSREKYGLILTKEELDNLKKTFVKWKKVSKLQALHYGYFDYKTI